MSLLALACLLAVCIFAGPALAQHLPPLPSPLRLADVLAYARDHRQEIVAARARARAAGERPAVASALEDPMVMPSIDHLPFGLHGADVSLMVEQRFPLSGVLTRKRRAAEAEARSLRADSERVVQDVQLEAARAFLMLHERRRMANVVNEQAELARQLAAAASARYAAGTGSQPEILRAELEAARLEGAIRIVHAEVTAAEAMLSTSLGRRADAKLPDLEAAPVTAEPPAFRDVQSVTLRRRPELHVARAEIGRSQAEIAEMEAMYWPMALVRTGPAYTMSDGWGWMLGIGVSVPIHRGRLEGGVREAEAMAAMARADLAAMTRMAEGEGAVARSQVLAARERVLTLRDHVLPRARQAIDPSVAAFASGTLPLAAALDTAQALWSVEAELVSAELDLGLAWARLHRAQGLLDVRALR